MDPMKRFLLVFVLAVAFVGVPAAPALAAASRTCHTAEPPTNGAPAAHALYVPSVAECTACHVGLTLPHTGQVTREVIWMRGRSIDAGYRLRGQIYDILVLGRSVQRADVTVYLQQRALGQTTFTDIGQATTNRLGNFGFTVTSPLPYAYYRAIAEGQIIPTRTALPCIEDLRPTPTLTLRLIGPTGGVRLLGHSITAKVKAKPQEMAGATVRFTVETRGATRWITQTTEKRVISASASCSWTYTPGARGLFRIRAANIKSADFDTKGSVWRKYRVR
jgi:hypothetical protein